MNIEVTIDRITGLNENRQGLAKATMTATANTNNIEASRSITYDLFFALNDYEERVLMKMLEKQKLHLHDDDFLFDEDDLRYLAVTKDLRFASYYPYLSDGRLEQIIREKLERTFDSEINAGNLRSSDVAKFLRESSFAKAIKILDDANKELQQIRSQEMEQSQESKNREIEANLEIAREDREDRQEHEKELVILKGEVDKEKALLTESMKGMAKDPSMR
jgi:hypothetical protein